MRRITIRATSLGVAIRRIMQRIGVTCAIVRIGITPAVEEFVSCTDVDTLRLVMPVSIGSRITSNTRGIQVTENITSI